MLLDLFWVFDLLTQDLNIAISQLFGLFSACNGCYCRYQRQVVCGTVGQPCQKAWRVSIPVYYDLITENMSNNKIELNNYTPASQIMRLSQSS